MSYHYSYHEVVVSSDLSNDQSSSHDAEGERNVRE
jgi:hypothetical protein